MRSRVDMPPMLTPETRQPCAYCGETKRPGGVYRGATEGPTARRFCSFSHLSAFEAWERYAALVMQGVERGYCTLSEWHAAIPPTY